MIQNYNEIHTRVNLFNSLFDNKGREAYAQVQKIISTHQYICLQVRLPGKTKYLYLGRGSGHEGVWCEDKRPPAPLRVIDRFIEYFRKHLSGHYIKSIALDPCDRIVYIPFGRDDERSIMALFYCGRDLFFAHLNSHLEGGYKLFLSWKKLEDPYLHVDSEEEALTILRNELNGVGRHSEVKQAEEVSVDPDAIANYFASLRGGEVQRITGRKRKFLNRKLKKIENDLQKIGKWNELKLEIERPNFSFEDSYEVVIAGIKFKFPGDLTHFKKMNIVYNKIKSLKNGESILRARYADCQAEILRGKELQQIESYKIPEKICSPIWAQSKQKKEAVVKDSSSGHILLEIFGRKAAIGVTANGNDYIRSKWASKNDLWFHVEGERSPHLIVKVDSIADLDDVSIQVIGSAIRDYGQMSFEQVPVIFTQVKNLKGVKGSPGKVIYKKIKHRTIDYLPKWKEIISMD